jgi:protein-tyrosine phosphatase
MTENKKTAASPALVRRAYRAARNLPDRLFHRRRHLAACRRLASELPPRRILVVCYGNVCRSPYLEAVLKQALPSVQLASAGFIGSDRRVPEASATVSSRRGIDLSGFRSRPLTALAVNCADLVIVMDANQARELTARYPITSRRIMVAGDLDPRFDETRAIRDPWNQSREVFEACFDRLERCAETLVASVQPRIISLGERGSRHSLKAGMLSRNATIPVAEAPHLQAL